MTPKRERELYEEAVGHPPRNLPPGHPGRWQWLYRGTRNERDGLLDRLRVAGTARMPVCVQERLL